jgi:hypothetical protein
VINLKWSGIAGGVGFVLSLLVGLLSGAGFPFVLIRAAVFGAIFFAFAAVVWFLINNFVPELLFPQTGETAEKNDEMADSPPKPGSRVNISVDDGNGSAMPAMYQNSSGDGEVGDISDLLEGRNLVENSLGMDQTRENRYTDSGSTVPRMETLPNGDLGVSGGSGASGPDLTGGLPDLDSVAGVFSSPAEEDDFEPTVRPEPERRPSGNKAQKMDGDFDAKSLAAGIRTILAKE